MARRRRSSAAETQPHLIAFQTGPTVLMTTRRSTSFPSDEGQEHAGAEIETVHDSEADQHAE